MTNLKWRLSKLPTPDEVRELVKDKIITQEEAREILFSRESEEDRDKDSLKEEIKFLRELVNKLSTRSTIVETIKYIEKPYVGYDWYTPYTVYCTAGTQSNLAVNYNSNSALLIGNPVCSYNSSNGDFTSIKTF